MLGRFANLCLLFFVGFQAWGEIVAWEADEFPEEDGWTIDQIVCDPELSVEDGWFTQQVDLCPGYPPPGGQFSSYERELDAFDGASSFFVQWRVHSDAPRSELFTWSGGATLATGGVGGVLYRCVSVSDQVWLLRDNRLPSVFVDIDPQTPHTYRLELRGEALYTWFIDGKVVDSGVPEGQFPSAQPAIAWLARAAWTSNTTRWDYIRYGDLILAERGDANCDGAVNNFDIDPFVQALAHLEAYSAAHPACTLTAADTNADGQINNFDIDPFIECLIAGCE